MKMAITNQMIISLLIITNSGCAQGDKIAIESKIDNENKIRNYSVCSLVHKL